jgi:uncharacterized protein YbjQ (UPF0145 family)
MYEDEDAYQHAINATKYLGALQEFDNYLRGRLKYEELPEAVYEALNAARQRLHEEANTMGASIWS